MRDDNGVQESLVVSDIQIDVTRENESTERDIENASTQINSQNTYRMSSLRFVVANARSLAPKIRSLIDYFNELELSFALITESWLKDGPELVDSLQDLEMGEDLKIMHHNRKSRRGRTAGGGVALVYDLSLIHI